MNKAIEVEYWVVDGEGALTSPEPLAGVSEYTEEEFVEPLFELKTPPCETVEELRATFLEQLEEVLEVADDHGKALVPLGTPIHGEFIEELDDERTRIQHEVLGRKFNYAKYCAGTHLHIEKRNVTDQLNTLIALDPALALMNSSPYFQGRWVADGARAYLYRKRGYEEYPKHGQLWDYVETVAEWERRLEHRFEEFRDAAVAEGVDEARVQEHFSVDDVVWTPVRLRDDMPTVEWRSPDATLPSQILRLAGEIDDLMERLHHTNVRIGEEGSVTDETFVLPEFETVCEHVETAIHQGLGSPEVVAYLDRMGLSVDEYDPVTRTFDRDKEFHPETARERRLHHAELLRRDVTTLLDSE